MDDATRNGLQTLRQLFVQDAQEFSGLHCRLLQKGLLAEALSHDPGLWRRVHVKSSESFEAGTREVVAWVDHRKAGNREREGEARDQQAVRLGWHRYSDRALSGAKFLSSVGHGVNRWTWAVFDWAWSLPPADPRHCDRFFWWQDDVHGLPGWFRYGITPEEVRSIDAKRVEDSAPLTYHSLANVLEVTPCDSFISDISDIFLASVDFIDAKLVSPEDRPKKRRVGRKPKEEKDSTAIVLANLRHWHRFDIGDKDLLQVHDPAPAEELAKNTSEASVSRALKDIFKKPGRKSYEQACRNGRLAGILALRSGELSEKVIAQLKENSTGNDE